MLEISLFGQEIAAGSFLDFSGKAAITDLKTVDGWSGTEVLSLRNLDLAGISFVNKPPALSVFKCSADGLQANFVKEVDGRSNLDLMLVEKDVQPKTLDHVAASSSEFQVKSSPNMALEFKTIALNESSVTFIDRSMSPSFKITLDDFGGEVEGLSSLGKKPAEVKLAGHLNGQAPVSVAGFIDPLAEDFFVDLKIDGQGIGMTDLTPYSGKFVGYAIGKGKISLDLACKVEHKKLVSSNAIFLDQFDFGSPVESPDALNLPVKLAVSLLRDRQGEIHLNLPVKGELDDPEFSLGGIIIKVFINLITKAITSPFALISSLAGGGEELNLVSFAAGQSNLDEIALGSARQVSRGSLRSSRFES